MSQFKSGVFWGTGAAVDISLGFIPDRVEVVNLSTTAIVYNGTCNLYLFTYTSGGTATPVVGDVMIGATSGAEATITSMKLDSGSWSAGSAAGRFTTRVSDSKGTFNSGENLYRYTGDVGSSRDDLTMTGTPVTHTWSIDTEVAGETTNTVTSYRGSNATPPGITVASTVATATHLFHYSAWAD